MKGNDQKEIQRLRLEGNGYVRIAQRLGLSENAVKSFCRRHPLQSTARQSRTKRTCPQCGTPISERRRFCSDACRTAWWNAHREHRAAKVQASFTCQHCGKVFSGHPKQQPKYCCHACYIAARYGKGREARG